MSTLGKNGRFGNQLFQYAFLKTYALRFQCMVQTPVWIGQHLFGLRDYPSLIPLPEVKQVSEILALDPIPHVPIVNVDFRGYFQYHTSYYVPFKAYIRSLFKPIYPLQALMNEGVRRLRSRGNTVVAFHFRRGDYENYDDKIFFIAPTSWYKKWLEENWSKLNNPVLFIASDEPEKVLGDFQEYHPVTSNELGISLPIAPYYPDFYFLSQSDIVLISNSTFSFAACMLNERGQLFLRPYKDLAQMIPFDPWNSEPLLRELST
jgi:hypothetical protein